MWYAEDGRVRRMMSPDDGNLHGYYYDVDESGDSTLLHSIFNDSVYCLATKEHPIDSVVSPEFEKTLYCQFTQDGDLYTRYFVDGLPAGTYGPHVAILGNCFETHSSGACAYTLRDTVALHQSLVVVVDSLGIESFSFDSERPVNKIMPAPSSTFVIVRYEGDGTSGKDSSEYACVLAIGEKYQIKLPTNTAFVAWIPGTTRMITSVSHGTEKSYACLDWAKGTHIWEQQSPIELNVALSSSTTAVVSDYFVVSGLAVRESISHGPQVPNDTRGPIRMIGALDLRTGKSAAQWYEPTFHGTWSAWTNLPPMPDRPGEFRWFRGQLYFVTESCFSRIDPENIRALSGGWVAPGKSENAHYDLSY
ncbi:MAG: hypothetical protein KKA42_08085 [candidate division Zixibacteria bacterium]|nr:hypothetical protein [candidate division Zixibacteria bacterium]